MRTMSEVQPTRASHHTLDQSPTQEEHTSSAQASPTSVEPVTPQDAQAAGASASEQRRHLQDNVSGSQQKGAAERAHELHEEQPGGTAGLHATGSRAGKQ
jgi:hypothetical protein